MDQLKDMDMNTLKAFCRTVLREDVEGREESDSKSEGQSESQDDPKEQDANRTSPGWEQDEQAPNYVFNLNHTATWPASKGASMREKALAARKKEEQSDA